MYFPSYTDLPQMLQERLWQRLSLSHAWEVELYDPQGPIEQPEPPVPEDLCDQITAIDVDAFPRWLGRAVTYPEAGKAPFCVELRLARLPYSGGFNLDHFTVLLSEMSNCIRCS